MAAGDDVEVDIRLDTKPREVALPTDLAAALDPYPGARAFFDGLTPSQRKAFVAPIEGAKKPETRDRRIDRTVTALLDGRKTPS